MIDAKDFYVLFFDTFRERHAEFQVKGSAQRHVHSLEEFKRVLLERKWDVVFIPTYMTTPLGNKSGYGKDDLDADKDAADKVVEQFNSMAENLRPGLVIYHGLEDKFGILPKLRHAGFLCTHVPWDITGRSDHTRFSERPTVVEQARRLLGLTK